METPKTKAGAITEAIMSIFWAPPKSLFLPELTTQQYNAVWEHVLHTLTTAGVK